jgi:effector-binding domain-containing protein/ribosome-associated toxin RatA of RatAB toxin-antitoxin module
MKILKYIFLLLLLSFVSFSVFIATQKGNFTIERSQVIHTSKADLYNYVNDYQNWEDFMAFMVEEAALKVHYSKTIIGKGAKCSWEGTEQSGTIQTFSVKENNSITQKMDLDGSKFNTTWIFKDTLGGTKVTLKSIGEMSFSYKIYTALHGGTSRIIGSLFEKSLANLDKSLDYEINTYSIKKDGIVTKLSTPYLKQSFTSKISSVVKNTRIIFPKIIDFCKQNKIALNGKPFVIYHTYDEKSGLAKISICVPIKEAIITSDGSDIMSDQLEAFPAIKATLKGDYSHIEEALKRSKAYINQKVITPNSRFSHLEVYTISKSDIKNPSKWKTEIYFPIKPKKVTPKIVHATEEISNPETNPSEI